eukprot:Transcript_14888.p1 GENE.Transcript_14888~~Transcript_14888.p1  ORF type:complete len:195 (-),score=30.22 Transcript_14888:213-734(-)
MLSLLSSAPMSLIVPTAPTTRVSSVRMADIGDTGVSFENVAREWRCKYTPGESGGPGDSASLKACQELLTEYSASLTADLAYSAAAIAHLVFSLCLAVPKLKALPKASITRQVCGGCMDFKVSITQPLEEHGAWAEADYNPLESVRARPRSRCLWMQLVPGAGCWNCWSWRTP